jgi:ribosomal protein S12 methylthiotransferase accessory factor
MAAAARKALLEAAHSLAARRYFKQQGYKAKPFDEIETFEDHAALYAFADMTEAFDFLLSAPFGPSLESPTEPVPVGPKLELEQCVEVLVHKGLEPVVVDLTTEDVEQLGFSVVRVLVPGLQPIEGCHKHRFLGGSRLVEVPRRLGYVDRRPRSLEELNPFPHPYP